MPLIIDPNLKIEEPNFTKCQEKIDIIAKSDIDEIRLAEPIY